MTNPIAVEPKENDLEELPDKEFERMVIAIFRRSKNKEMKEIKKSTESEEGFHCALTPHSTATLRATES